jgi:hypothetical protein
MSIAPILSSEKLKRIVRDVSASWMGKRYSMDLR